MADQTIYLKNQNPGDLEIPDIGLVLEGSENILTSDQFDYGELCSSEDLKTLITAGSIIVNDGDDDLSIEDALKYLRRQNVLDLERHYYSKKQLGKAGESKVHWDNIFGAPSFGSPSVQLTPIKYFLNISATEPDVGKEGSIYYNSTSKSYFKVIDGKWVSIGDVKIADRIINITDNKVYEYDGTDFVLSADNPVKDNYGVVIDDDGDGKQAQYVHGIDSDGTTTTTSWGKIGDIDFGSHLNGKPGKHKTTEISTIADLSTIGSKVGESLSKVLELIDKKLKSCDNVLNNFKIINNTYYIKDSEREKQLGNRFQFELGKTGICRNMYLRTIGNIPSNLGGLKIPKNSVLVGASATIRSTSNLKFHVRKNNEPNDLSIITISSATGVVVNDLNVDFKENDTVLVKCTTDSNARDGKIILFFAEDGGDLD